MRASLYEKQENNKVKCLACAHKCVIFENNIGICSVRKNIKGDLFLESYASAASFGVDPIEKKPLYHFLPGSLTFSFGTLGCNFKCVFCQNHEISMPKEFKFDKNLSPARVVDLALENNCKSISYTYTEPLVFAEYAFDTALLAQRHGLKNIFVTNGFFSHQALEKFIPILDAVNIDLKSFSDDFYKKRCKANLEPVLNSIKKLVASNVWVEITTLLIPDLNDSEDELRRIAKFIYSLDKNIPWHISRFFPSYKESNRSSTSLEKLELAKKIAFEEGLKHVYIGNTLADSNTFCSSCGNLLITRTYSLLNGSVKKVCECGEKLEGVFDD